MSSPIEWSSPGAAHGPGALLVAAHRDREIVRNPHLTEDWAALAVRSPNLLVAVQAVLGPDVAAENMEVGGDGVHQSAGEVHFLGAQRDVLGSDAGRGAGFVGPQEAVEQQGVVAHPDHGQRLAGPQRYPDDGDLTGL